MVWMDYMLRAESSDFIESFRVIKKKLQLYLHSHYQPYL